MADKAQGDRKERVTRAFEAKAAKDVDYLIGALRDPDVRGIAAKWLAKLGEQRAVVPLILLLDAHDPIARSSSADALGRLGAQQASTKLLELAENDPVKAVREWALGALARLQEPRAVSIAVRMLDDPDRRIRRYAAKCLGEIGDTRALEPLAQASAKEHWYARRSHRRALEQIRPAA